MTAVSVPSTGWAATRRLVLTPRRQLARGIALAVFALSASLLLELFVVSNLQQRAAQQRAFDAFRSDLAAGTAPLGPVDFEGKLVAQGAPVAFLEIPAIGLRQVIGEGTDPSTLFDGPGHRRDTPLPGQLGTSLIMGRRAAFGGPFADVHRLDAGDEIKVTTGQGTFEFTVRGVRQEGERGPAPIRPGEGRLMLVTADGRPFLPDGVLRVDAVLEGTAQPGPARLVSGPDLPASEQLMGADTSTLWALTLWLQLLLLAVVGAVWAWHRLGRATAWVMSLPVLLLVGINVAGEAARILPNLL